MAYLNTTFAPAASLTATLSELATRYKKYRLYRETLSGLNALSDRELSDLGLHRSELRRVAKTSAQR
jgi:uncharacterized protein YjiS (DUF1127 family)